ncbi:chorismate-binding protein, partial [Candidatus Riflebacteria bacterium]
FSAIGNRVKIITGNKDLFFDCDPIQKLREQLAIYRCATAHHIPNFVGGAIGFLAYDAVRLFEDIPCRHADEDNIPDMFFNFYKSNITFDHQNAKVVISVVIDSGKEPEINFKTAENKITGIIKKILSSGVSKNALESPALAKHGKSEVKIDLDDRAYADIVEKAKEYIVKGDAFQIVPSRRFQKPFSALPFDIYRALRICSPAPYMFFIDNRDYVVTGASPEKFVSLHNNIIESTPIAGTRPRGASYDEHAMEIDLLQDEKEVAEHMMLVDLFP